ncbi:MAG: NAD(P)/FAD-dependent oxidoreductase [Pikeienuella sp.]
MNLLHANDALGQHAPSYYAATVPPTPLRPQLTGAHTADVCVIGAGYTGLSAALHLAEAGLNVVVLDAHRAGWGASGRNGGQLGGGQRVDQAELEAQFGQARAKALWDLGEAAKDLTKDLIAKHKIAADLTPGIMHTAHRERYIDDLRHEVDHMADIYDYPLEFIDKPALRDILDTKAYHAAVLDRDAAHLHPLKYALGLAHAAEAAGATIYELSEVTAVTKGAKPHVATALGEVSANHVIFACNGYLGDIAPAVAARVMPINNYILATEPLEPALAQRLIANNAAVADSKFVINYYRLSADNRLLFGGRESYGYRFPADIKAFVRKAMLDIYPQLSETGIDYGWGGTLAITMNRLPHLTRVSPNMLSASGYSGHGVAMATFCGMLAADAVRGQADRFDAMAAIPTPRFPGGSRLRSPLLALAMAWYALRDRL